MEYLGVEELAVEERAVARRRTLAVAGSLVLAFAIAGWVAGAPLAARAADEPSWAYDLWHDTMSPYCPGRTLAECPSPQADKLRIWILTQAAAGAERAEIEASLYARFGDQVRSTPKGEGWGLAAYVIPVVAFVVFGGVVFLVLRRLVANREPIAEPIAEPTAEPTAQAVAGAVRRPAPVAGGGYSDAELERMVDEEFGA